MFSTTNVLFLVILLLDERAQSAQNGQWTDSTKSAGKDKVRKVVKSEVKNLHPWKRENHIFNEWNRFDDWTCNAPHLSNPISAAFSTAKVNEEEQLHRAVVFGGRDRLKKDSYLRPYLNTTTKKLTPGAS